MEGMDNGFSLLFLRYNGSMKIGNKLSVPLVQLGLALGLYFILLWGGPFSDGFASAPTLRDAYVLALHGGFVITFAALFLRKGVRLHTNSVFLALCGIAGLLGSALPALTAGYSQWQVPAIALSAFLSSCAVAMLLFVGIRSLAALSVQDRFSRFLAAAGVGLAVFLVVFRMLPEDYRSLANCVVLFPLALLATFSAAGSLKKDSSLALPPTPRMLQLCLSVFLLGLVSTLLIQAGEVVQIYQIAIAVVSGAVFVLLWRVRKQALGVTEIYLVLFPVVATLLLALPFGGSALRNVAIFVSNAAVEILLLAVFVRPEPREGAYAPRLIVALLATFHCSALVGVAGGTAFRSLFGGDNTLMAGALYFLLYALSAFAFVLLSRRGKREGVDEPVESSASKVSSSVEAGESTAEARCVRAVAVYGLSPREAEVLDLLLKGRDVRAIADMLVISPNTVRFHVKNLYKMVGVHGKQELIDAIEQLS